MTTPFMVKALYAFQSENDAEIALQVGDRVKVLSTADPGWWEGQRVRDGKRGLFPSNYVEKTNEPVVNTPAVPQRSHQPAPAPAPASPRRAAPAASPVNGFRTAGGPSSPKAQNKMLNNNNQHNNNNNAITSRGQTFLESQQNMRTTYTPAQAAPGTSSKTPTCFGPWAHNMAMMTGLLNIVLGAAGVFWYQNDTLGNFGSMTQTSGIYAIVISVIFLILEFVWGQGRTAMRFPLRGVFYVCASVPMFFGIPTILGGVFLITVGLVNTLACLAGEVYDAPKPAPPAQRSGVLAPSKSFWEGLKQYYLYIYQQNKLGQALFLLAYAAANLALFINQVVVWRIKNNDLAADQKLSNWGPWAKGFGGLLNLNCSLIVVPVLRTLLRYLYNRSTRDQGFVSRMLRGILYFVPIDLNIAFHKLIAGMIMFAALGHVIMHLINAGLAYNNAVNRFGWSPWWTGGVISWCMLFIYSAVLHNVKNGHFEIFWYAHHAFIVFFGCLLFHGAGGIGPNYWKFFLGPGTLYLIERVLRYMRSREPVEVTSVTLMGDVFSLTFAKSGVFAEKYQEGMYIFLNCPAISRFQWHPFTISSAPEEKTVSVHIRVQGEGSWTRNVSQYIGSMGPMNRAYFELDRLGPNGRVAGKILGPDGRAMLSIDGPHSAPTQHMSEYSVAMVVGAGIGATPLSSAMRSVVFHRWKYFIGQCFPDHAYFMWVCAHRDIDAFRWLIRRIKEAQDEVVHMRSSNAQNMMSKTFEVHIFLTSAPKTPVSLPAVTDDSIGFWGCPSEEATLDKAHSTWSEMDLYRAMKIPSKHKQLGDVHVWEGRPNWKTRFDEVSQRHKGFDVGVLFCGNPMIATDLEKFSHQTNHQRSTATPPVAGLFKMHKENF